MSNQSSTVSIVIPVYNCEKYLGRCIESIRKQSFQDYEVLLVDDGSKDLSGEECDEIARHDARFKSFHIENSGAANARNFALDRAKGDYITFIDADDYIEPDYLRNLVEAIQKYNVDIAQCLWRRPNSLYKEGNEFPTNFESRFFNSHEALLDFVTENRLCNSVWGKLFRSELFAHLRFPQMKTGEDSMLLIETYRNVQKVVSIPYVGYIYFLNEQGLDSSRKNDLNSVRVGKYLVDYAAKNDEKLLPTAVAKYSVFLVDAFCEAVKSNRFDITRQLSDDFASIALKGTKELGLKMKLIIVLFHINKRMTEKIFIRRFR